MTDRTLNAALILERMQDDINCGKLRKLIMARYSVLGGFRCAILGWDELFT